LEKGENAIYPLQKEKIYPKRKETHRELAGGEGKKKAGGHPITTIL